MDAIGGSLSFTQDILTRYGMTTYFAFGNIGLFFNLNIFSRSIHRRNPGSLYILSMTICNFFCLNFGIIPFIYALNHPDPVTTSLIMCKLQFYLRHTPYQMMRSFMILSCFNRYISSHVQHRFQNFNQYQITIRCIIIVIIFWLLVCIFIPILLSIEANTCGMFIDSYALLYSIYILIFAGILPPLVMIICSFLIIKNLKKIRSRVQPLAVTSKMNLIRKRDRDYIRMLLVEIMVYVLLTFPYTLSVFYTTVDQLGSSEYEYEQWEIFLIYFTRSFLLYLNSSLSFWIYIIMSKSFRNEFHDLLLKWYLILKKFKDKLVNFV
ncbi:unnamed protein product [Adineta steineri]|uniref:G-protein coupled receptors family 1 profile domain-containing protein n=1 Tax=Adineta steineri TaxID=433720 RepID=A0A814WTB0_9BILA|nr:unnamed protein product [Adineta steineri]CAF3788615.1 unnamed protein product [Adineta steineri]